MQKGNINGEIFEGAIISIEFTADMLMDLRYFFANEYESVEKYSYLYDDKKKRDILCQPRDMSRTITRLNETSTFATKITNKTTRDESRQVNVKQERLSAFPKRK